MLRAKMLISHNTENVNIPSAGTVHSSGLDLKAIEDVKVEAFGTAIVRTGIVLEYLEPGFELQVRPRGGVSLKTPISIANSPGTVDNDYRGELMVIVRNNSDEDFHIGEGIKIAQAVISPVVYGSDVEIDITSKKNETDRGDGALGSTGK